MRKTILWSIIALLLPCFQAVAEDVIQILPATTFVGANEDDEQYMEVQMVNDTYDEVGIVSFDLLLPEGITFLYEDFEGERVPFTKKGKNITYDFSLFEPTLQESGYTRYLLVPGGQVRPITGKSGTFMYLFIEVDEGMAPGVYPILMQETLIGKSETEGLYPEPSVSYIVVKAAESDASPLATETNIDLSAMTGYMPSFVVEALNTELAANTSLVSVNLGGVTGLGANLTMPEDVAWWTATEAGLQRTFAAEQWSTVCLPFAVGEEQLTAIKAQGVEIEQFASYDEAANEVAFETVSEMEANKPYLVKCASAMAPFAKMEIVSVDGALTAEAVGQGKVTMTGTFSQLTLDSSDDVSYFVFNAADGEFVRVGKNCTVPPFRAYITLDKASTARHLYVRHDNGTTTSIDDSWIDDSRIASPAAYDLQGRRVAIPTASSQPSMRKVIISNGQKHIVK